MTQKNNEKTIKNHGEIVGFIIYSINKSSSFKVSEIIELTQKMLENSPLKISDFTISRMVYNVLDVMLTYGYISYSNNIYKTISTNFTLDDYYHHYHSKPIIL